MSDEVGTGLLVILAGMAYFQRNAILEKVKSINNKIPNNLQGSTSMTTSSSSSHPKNIFVGGRMIGMSTSTTTSSSASHPQGMYRTY